MLKAAKGTFPVVTAVRLMPYVPIWTGCVRRYRETVQQKCTRYPISHNRSAPSRPAHPLVNGVLGGLGANDQAVDISSSGSGFMHNEPHARAPTAPARRRETSVMRACICPNVSDRVGIGVGNATA